VRRLPFTEPEEIAEATREAVRVVAAGGVLLLPTETFYGLGADPSRAKGVTAVCGLKNRSLDHGLPVLCADWRQVESLVDVPERYRVRLSRLWPAALTVVLRARAVMPACRAQTLAVRIPAHDALRALLYRVGPLTGTSANRHGKPPCTSVDESLNSLCGTPDLVLDGGPTAGGQPSTLVDLSGDEAEILRPGSCPWGASIPESRNG
jgi:tRNA threonylcarbamoyl adenosine modification protein (Sua5/YciO/YrdC/YwlC family)